MQERTSIPVAVCAIVFGLYATAALMVGPARTAPADFDHRKLAEVARTIFILPKYTKLEAGIKTLRTAISALC